MVGAIGLDQMAAYDLEITLNVVNSRYVAVWSMVVLMIPLLCLL